MVCVWDWLTVPTDADGGHLRRGQVVAVPHPDGSPPYRVRWLDDDHESLLFPPPGTHVDHPSGHASGERVGSPAG